jgi:alpha-amylase
MKKRIYTLISLLMIFSIIAMGCNNVDTESQGKNTGMERIEDDGNMAGSETDENDNSDGDEPITTAVSYAYEQELNMIDDNYRNYYEIFTYSFCDSNGDGIGDINGIISKLGYITDMGFNGIWLMPMMPSPTYHKYDVTDYYNIDPQYGTLEDFKKLIAECDKRGIKLIIDLVFNHTSTKHPWFMDAVTYLEGLQEGEEPDAAVCPSIEYYHFTKEDKGSKYHRAGNSDWFYECVFWDQMPDLALESKALRGEIEKIAKFWLDLGVDGFRLDAAKEYYTGETSKNVEVLHWFSDYVTSIKKDAYIVGEVWDEGPVIASYYESGTTSFFDFPLAQYNGLIASVVRKLGTSTAKSFADNVVKLQQAYKAKNPNFIDAPFISNHDTTRASAQLVNDPNLMKMAAGLLLTMNGSPFVYYGEEIGMNSKGDKDENKRLPMQWSASETAGMTKGPAGAETVEQRFPSLEEQLKDPLSIVNYYKRSVRIRNENPEIARGELSVIEELSDSNICAFKKVYKDSELDIVYNISPEAVTVDLSIAGLESKNIRGYLTVDGSEVKLTDGILSMPLYSIVILK